MSDNSSQLGIVKYRPSQEILDDFLGVLSFIEKDIKEQTGAPPMAVATASIQVMDILLNESKKALASLSAVVPEGDSDASH